MIDAFFTLFSIIFFCAQANTVFKGESMMKNSKDTKMNNKQRSADDRGDSIDQLQKLEAANSMIAEKEIGQQNENL